MPTRSTVRSANYSITWRSPPMPDKPDALDPVGMKALRGYVEDPSRFADTDWKTGTGSPDLHLMSRTEFVDKILHPHAVRDRATIVGFNLNFDLSRIAVHAGRARN